MLKFNFRKQKLTFRNRREKKDVKIQDMKKLASALKNIAGRIPETTGINRAIKTLNSLPISEISG